RTVPSISVTLNSVHAFDAGATFTSPAVAAISLDVDTVTPPCSISTDAPSNCTRESARTVMLEPDSLIFATESERVWRRSPEKIAEEERGTCTPFTQA